MKAVAQCYDRGPLFARPGHAELHRLERNRLTEAAMAVDHQDRPLVTDYLGMLVGLEIIFRPAAYVERQHAHAVGIMAGKVGGDQMIGHQLRLSIAAAHPPADRSGQVVKFLARHDRHVRSPIGALIGSA